MTEDADDLLNNESSLYRLFPFMSSFPYDDYTFSLEEGESKSTGSNINPIIIEAAGKIVEPSLVTFSTQGHIANISISFYSYDIKYVRDVSNKVRKMDKMSETLSLGVDSMDFMVKLSAIKEGSKFLKKIGSSLEVADSFNKILDGFLESHDLSLTTSQEKAVKKLSSNIDQDDFSEDLQEIILEFYNLHLHHIRILLGVVIASKIH